MASLSHSFVPDIKSLIYLKVRAYVKLFCVFLNIKIYVVFNFLRAQLFSRLASGDDLEVDFVLDRKVTM